VSEESGRIAWINFWKPKDDWYYLAPDKRRELLERWQDIRSRFQSQGARHTGTYECRANTDWARVSLWEFADISELTRMVEELADASYYQFFAESNAFGFYVEEPYRNYVVAADATVAQRL
jgi:chlorite dismutase